MSTSEGFPSAAPEVFEVQDADNPMQAGAEILLRMGVGYEVSGIQLVGPRPECQGTIADIVGMTSHSDMKDSIIRVVEQAKAKDEDPAEAVRAAVSLFAKRDESGNVVKVSEDMLKKK